MRNKGLDQDSQMLFFMLTAEAGGVASVACSNRQGGRSAESARGRAGGGGGGQGGAEGGIPHLDRYQHHCK